MRRSPRAAAARGLAALICLLLGISGCTLNLREQATSHVTVTEPVAHSAFVAVTTGATPAPSLARLVGATARPGETVDVLWAGARPALVTAASSPPPVRAVLPGKPAAPGAGATSFQRATYQRSLTRWRGDVASAAKAAAARTRAALTAWAKDLGIARKLNRLSRTSGPRVSLARECAIAASTLAGLDQSAGASFGGRRVVLLYAPSLAGALPPGELTGDDVIVVTPFLPAAASVSAAQTHLLAAGATRADILGPESTPGQLSQLVTFGLSHKAVTETLSGAALFANNSAQLAPAAARVLRPLIQPLRTAGTTAVINGYASAPGTRKANYLLSYARAATVAAFLEAHGIPASSLDVVGHGASDLVAAGPPAASRRVVVVIEEPAG